MEAIDKQEALQEILILLRNNTKEVWDIDEDSVFVYVTDTGSYYSIIIENDSTILLCWTDNSMGFSTKELLVDQIVNWIEEGCF